MASAFALNIKVTRMFFDRKAVVGMMEDHARKSLSKFGAYVRQRARTSIKRAGKGPAPRMSSVPGRRRRGRPRKPIQRVSQPGKPPLAHSTDSFATIKNILFAWDPVARSVVIGPVALNVVHHFKGTMQGGVVPGVLEFGGTLGIPEVWSKSQNQWVRADLRSRRRIAGRPQRLRKARYLPRPYMGPAFAKELANLPRAWQSAGNVGSSAA